MKISYRKIWTVAYPVLISLLMQDLIGLTDTAFLGRVGEVELGASAIGGIFYLVIFMLGFGFGVGAEILMARRNGEGSFRAIGRIFYQGSVMLIALALLMFGLYKVLGTSLLRNVIASEDIFRATIAYTDWRIYGLFFSFMVVMFRSFYMAVTKTKILTLNGIIMLVCNVFLNYVLIFGKFGMPALGITGAAVASTISEGISLLFFILYTASRKDFSKYGLFRFGRLSLAVQRQIISVSSWTTIQYFISCGTWMFFFMAIEHLGERPLAISNIVRSVSTLLYMFVSAYGYTGSALVSNLMGEGKQSEVPGLIRKVCIMCGVMILPLFIFAGSFPQTIMRIFTDDAMLIANAVPSMLVMLSSYIVTVPGYIVFLAVSGTGNTRKAFWLELSVTCIYVIFVWLVAVRLRADIAVCWTSDWVYSTLLLLLSIRFFMRSDWRSKKI